MNIARVGQVQTFVADGVTNHVLLRWGKFDSTNLLVIWTVMSPGGVQRGHQHAGSEQLYVIISGKARMQVGEETQIIGGGTAVYVPPSVPHGIANAGGEELSYIAIASPPFPLERFFAQSRAREVAPGYPGGAEGETG